MELLYTVSEKRSADDAHLTSLYNDGGVCAVSTKSVVAFTRMTTRQDNYRHRTPVCSICVMDLNTPNEPHVILECASKVLWVVFSSEGSQLLVALNSGRVHLFTKRAALHDWSPTHVCNWDGEELLHINFFHGGIRASLQSGDVKVHAQYMEKFTALPHKPSLVDHGQCAMKGFFAVSASGLLLVCVMNHEGGFMAEKKVVLGQKRDNFTVATAALAPTGYIHIATWKPEMIKCWRAELKMVEVEGGKGDLSITIQAAQSFCPSKSGASWHGSQKSEGLVHVTCLRYTELEVSNSLLVALTIDKTTEVSPSQQPGGVGPVAASVNQTHLVRRYQLQDQLRPLLKVLKAKSDSVGIATKEWVCEGEWVCSSRVVTLGSPTRHLLPGTSPAPFPLIITAATVDASVYAINRDTMQQLSSHSVLNVRGSGDDAGVSKRAAVSRRVVSLAHTWSGLSLLAMDSAGSIHFITLVRPADVGPQWAISLILLLEFALVSGLDWWDLLVTTQHSSILTLTDRLSDTFHQHSAPLTQHLHTSFLVLKTSMLRLLGSQQQKAIEARLQAQLTATQQLFRSIRPVTCDVVTAEKNISVAIQSYLESRSSLDILDLDKSVDHLCNSISVKDCQVDPGQLQNLQPLIQFATDLALFILFMLAQNSKFELARDPKIVQSLRELVFVARLWHRQNKLVQPQMLHKTHSVDVWAQIYKLLTRLALILPGEPDSSLIASCLKRVSKCTSTPYLWLKTLYIMSKKHINAILILGVIVPLLLSTCILIVFVMVIPNSSLSGVSSSDSSVGSDKHPGQVSSQQSETKSHLLFTLGIVFACGLFVFLIIIVTVVCIWVRQAQGYKLSEHFTAPPPGKDPECHLTRHTLNKDSLPYDIQDNSRASIYLNGKEEKRHSSFVASIPSHPPITTVPVTAQYPGKNISEGGINTDPYQIVQGSRYERNSNSSQVSHTQNYGTLSRTHLLSSCDEDGYHFDNLGIDNAAVSKEDFCPSFDEVPSPVVGELTDGLLSASNQVSGASSPDPLDSGSVFTEGDSDTQDKSDNNKVLEKQLSKQDSFQGLPPFKSFDKYLTIVRLDSTTSLDSNTFEDTKKTWSSIEEEDEREETNVIEEEKGKH
ncbi:hypothetical protein Pcinc_037139 [Petrolisthes cinctipes]|uniref:Mediator of RNA polymerase II transcription subunit 16 n=1 Tax=Petrolisthes cinctipes TaxID=88211 RepID=A0AAE1BTD6_PETCI|nr:hypothetical protein Pcinc_037139 [Petrolisthes cinctipes]